MLKTLLGIVVVFIIGALLFIYSGIYNIAADEPHLSLTRWVLETTRNQSIAKRDDSVTVPSDLASSERVLRGAKLYGSTCQMCHLGPGLKPTSLHEGLNPKPPRLAEKIGHHSHSLHSPEKLFWIVKHGIKMTGMAAWGKTHGDQELWDVIAFLNKLPQMTPQQYKELTHGANKSSNSSARKASSSSLTLAHK